MDQINCKKENQPWCFLDQKILNDKVSWGRAGWDWAHKVSIKYSDNPSIQEKKDMIFLFWNFIYGVPCIECRVHAYAYAEQFPPKFDNSHTLQIWFWRFHNYVNRRLGKKIISSEQYQELYKDDINAKCALQSWK